MCDTHAKNLRFPLCGFGGFLLVEAQPQAPRRTFMFWNAGDPCGYAMEEDNLLVGGWNFFFRSPLRQHGFHIGKGGLQLIPFGFLLPVDCIGCFLLGEKICVLRF